MNEWHPARWTVPFTEADEKAFSDPLRVNAHFGLPLPMAERVFSISLNETGLTNVHDSGKKFRKHYLGNTMAIRLIKRQHPDAWIWDERFRFALECKFTNKQFAFAQKEFIRMMGADRILEIGSRVKNAGLEPGGKSVGRPDMAVYVPGDEKWRFVEIKIPERGDELGLEQVKWLQLLSDYFGAEAAVELELVREERKEE